MDATESSLLYARKLLDAVMQKYFDCIGIANSQVPPLLLKEKEKLEEQVKRLELQRKEELERLELQRKEELERLELQRKEELERLQKDINEKHEELMSLFGEGKNETDPAVKLLTDEKRELERQVAILRRGPGSQQVELLVEMRDKQNELEKRQLEMLDLLQSKQVTEVNISRVDSRVRASLMLSCGFTTILEETETSEPSVGHFRSFGWPQGNEEKDSSLACEHFQQELKSFGVKFGPGWWKLLDVRGEKNFLSVQVGDIALLGTADAVIVPYSVAKDGASYQIRVVLEWKLPRSSEWTSCKGQAFAELIAAYARSKSPLIVVLTDLQSRFHILKPCLGEDGNLCVAECLNLTPLQAMKKVADFLASISRSNDYDFNQDHAAAATAYAKALKRIKETIPENPLARVLALADFLPPAEREQLIWDAFAGQQLWSYNSEAPLQMFG